MSCCKKRRKGKKHHNGVVYRVTNSIAQQFGIKRKLVLAGFIVGLVFQAPLTLFVFLVAFLMLEHPEKAEPIKQKISDFFASSTGQSSSAPKQASATPGMEPGDFDFSGLRRKFAELEQRAGEVERHVTSDEFELNREFKRMKDDEK